MLGVVLKDVMLGKDVADVPDGEGEAGVGDELPPPLQFIRAATLMKSSNHVVVRPRIRRSVRWEIMHENNFRGINIA